MSGAITKKKEVYEKCLKVFEATLENLPDIILILTLGKEPFEFLKCHFPHEITGNWPEVATHNVLSHFTHKGKKYCVGSIYHTSMRGIIGRARQEGYRGKNSFNMGYEACLNDLKLIFQTLNFI